MRFFNVRSFRQACFNQITGLFLLRFHQEVNLTPDVYYVVFVEKLNLKELKTKGISSRLCATYLVTRRCWSVYLGVVMLGVF